MSLSGVLIGCFFAGCVVLGWMIVGEGGKEDETSAAKQIIPRPRRTTAAPQRRIFFETSGDGQTGIYSGVPSSRRVLVFVTVRLHVDISFRVSASWAIDCRAQASHRGPSIVESCFTNVPDRPRTSLAITPGVGCIAAPCTHQHWAHC